jgi:uncharacterized protein RhaS with RHS repeats
MYQPELGRFLQPDPKQFAAGEYNLYRYCHNDPVNKSDPPIAFGIDQKRNDVRKAEGWCFRACGEELRARRSRGSRTE